jgi:hypothetical protein
MTAQIRSACERKTGSVPLAPARDGGQGLTDFGRLGGGPFSCGVEIG